MDKRHIVIGDRVNSSLVVLREGVIVVDTSVDEETAFKLHAEAIGSGKMLYVINTHEHGDHLAGNGLFECPIISSAVAREQMLAGNKPPALPKLVFSDRMELFLSEQVVLQHFGGQPSLAQPGRTGDQDYTEIARENPLKLAVKLPKYPVAARERRPERHPIARPGRVHPSPVSAQRTQRRCPSFMEYIVGPEELATD
nr:MBL fold metallo-hydrolase [Aquisalimonas sp.]